MTWTNWNEPSIKSGYKSWGRAGLLEPFLRLENTLLHKKGVHTRHLVLQKWGATKQLLHSIPLTASASFWGGYARFRERVWVLRAASMHTALLGAVRVVWSLSCALLVNRKEGKKSSNFHLPRYKIKNKKKPASLIVPSMLLGSITLVLALTGRIKGICWPQAVWASVSSPCSEAQKREYFKRPCNKEQHNKTEY